MSEQKELIRELIHVLEREKKRGRTHVWLDPAVRDLVTVTTDSPSPQAPRDRAAAKAADNGPERPPATGAGTPTQPQPPAGSPARQRTQTAAYSSGAELVAEGSGECDHAGWEELEQAVSTCRDCPLSRGRRRPVFGSGNRRARLMFIGEGPGADEDARGLPFVGKAGQLLTRMIQAMQFRREDVYIANIVKCRPPGNRVPQDAEAACCLKYLNRQIDLVKPEVIILLGSTPLKYLLGKSGINRHHGQWEAYRGVPTLPSFHPAYLLRSPAKKRQAWEDLQEAMRKLGKAPENTTG